MALSGVPWEVRRESADGDDSAGWLARDQFKEGQFREGIEP
jgi:hypothetical protein